MWIKPLLDSQTAAALARAAVRDLRTMDLEAEALLREVLQLPLRHEAIKAEENAEEERCSR